MKLLKIDRISYKDSYDNAIIFDVIIRDLRSGRLYEIGFDIWSYPYRPSVGDYIILSDCILDKRSEAYTRTLYLDSDLSSGRNIEYISVDEGGDLTIFINHLTNCGYILKRQYG